MELNTIVAPSTESIVVKDRRRLEERNKIIFSIFRALGFFPIKLDPVKSLYSIRPVYFIIAYTFWFVWPLLGLGVAFYGMKVFDLDGVLDQVDKVIEKSLFILGFAVAPAIMTYSIKLMTKYLPEILEDISNLCDMDVRFKTPLNIRIPSRKPKTHSSMAVLKNSEKPQEYEKMLFYMPLATVFLAIVAFIIAWVFGLLEVVEWSTLQKEWPFYVMQFSYLTQPTITTWFCIVFIEWMRLVYEAFRIEFDCLYHNTLNYIKETTKPKIENDFPADAFNEDYIKVTGDYVDKIQEIFLLLNEGFVKFVASVNFLVFLISAVFCTLEMLKSFHLIMYIIPLAISVCHMALICYKSNCLLNEYGRILLVLKRTVRLERRHPDLLPYSELHILRENLLELPPQIVIFGGYPVGNGLLVAAQGFIISYAVLANDILDMQAKITPPVNVTFGG